MIVEYLLLYARVTTVTVLPYENFPFGKVS